MLSLHYWAVQWSGERWSMSLKLGIGNGSEWCVPWDMTDPYLPHTVVHSRATDRAAFTPAGPIRKLTINGTWNHAWFLFNTRIFAQSVNLRKKWSQFVLNLMINFDFKFFISLQISILGIDFLTKLIVTCFGSISDSNSAYRRIINHTCSPVTIGFNMIFVARTISNIS